VRAATRRTSKRASGARLSSRAIGRRSGNTYRIDRTYLWNYEHGPAVGDAPVAIPTGQWKEFLGVPVRSRIGIAAGILLNSRWIEAYARLGFDILTYKTVRSAARPCYPLPNWVYVEPPRSGSDVAHTLEKRPPAGSAVTSAVCFGMPSMEPAVWRADVRKARRALRRGKLLIVSVVGTPLPGLAGGPAAKEQLAADFVRCARWAAEAGADAVEANFSCPNVESLEGSVYQDRRFARELVGQIRAALPSTPLLVKAGRFAGPSAVHRFQDAVEGIAHAIVIVNGVQHRVIGPDGRSVFPGHERVGVIGSGIHAAALSDVRAAVARARRTGLATQVVAVGGVLDAAAAADFFDAGAAAVLSGGGAALDPLLAVKLKSAHPEW
jgi:dihydroorotate dehydrogenase (NAD+) catalytic subunit